MAVSGTWWAAVLAGAEAGRGGGNARLAVRLLNQATAIQARRLAAQGPAALRMITGTDMPGQLQSCKDSAPGEDWPGQYL